MKRKLYILCLAVLVLCLTAACVRYDLTIKFHANGTADTRILVAVSDSMASMTDGSFTLTSEQIREMEAKGYSYEPYSESGYTGYTLTRKNVKLSELENVDSTGGPTPAAGGSSIRVDGKHVTVDIPFTGENLEDNSEYLSMIGKMGGYMRITMEFPAKPTNHNATSVSKNGKELTWDLTQMKPGDTVHAEFDLPSYAFLAWLLPLIGVVVAAAAVALILWLRRKKAKAAAITESPESQDSAGVPTEEEPQAEESAEQLTAEEPVPDEPGDSTEA